MLCRVIPSPNDNIFFYGLRMMTHMITVIPDTVPIPFTIRQLCSLCEACNTQLTAVEKRKAFMIEIVRLIESVLMYRPISIIRDFDAIVHCLAVICRDTCYEVLEIIAKIMKRLMDSGRTQELNTKFQKMDILMNMFNHLIRDMKNPLVNVPCISPYLKMLSRSMKIVSEKHLVIRKLMAIGYDRIVDLACNKNHDISRYALQIIIQVLSYEELTNSRDAYMHEAVISKDLIKNIIPTFEDSTTKRKLVMAEVIEKAMKYDKTNAFNDAMNGKYLACVASLAADAMDTEVATLVVKTLAIMIEAADSIGMLPFFYRKYMKNRISDLIMEIPEREDDLSGEMWEQLSKFDLLECEMCERLGIPRE